MKIAITGGNGFIGSSFLKRYESKFDQVVKLTSKKALAHNEEEYSLSDLQSIVNATKGVETLIHCAFDHRYKENIAGIKNILTACKTNSIGRLIYLSTVSVYDPFADGDLTERSKYSNLNDPYSMEKIKIEKIIDASGVENTIVLQPAIVFGLGGNWSKYAFNVSKAGSLLLPVGGVCNPVFVSDICDAIYNSIIKDQHKETEKYLLSGPESTAWDKFYLNHDEICKQLGNWQECVCIQKSELNNYHNNPVLNIVFTSWYHTPIGHLANRVVDIIKSARAKSYKTVSNADDIKQLCSDERDNRNMSPIGINRLVHNAKFNVCYKKASKELMYSPTVTLSKGMKIMQREING